MSLNRERGELESGATAALRQGAVVGTGLVRRLGQMDEQERGECGLFSQHGQPAVLRSVFRAIARKGEHSLPINFAMRARRKLRVGWQKGRGQRRYHRYHKDIMSMMSKPSLRHHTKYDINVIFYEIMHPADLTFEMGFCLGDVAASRIRESLCSGCAERDDTARYPRTEQLPPRHREISPRSRTN